MAYQFMQANKNRYAITEMAAMFGVKRSAYYKWTKHGVSELRSKADADLLELVKKIVGKHKRRYGSPRVRRELRVEYGKSASQKRVARLMRENGLNAKRKGRYIPTTDSKHTLDVCENILNREFHAEKAG
jgi:transposase InsO family protein